MFEMKVASICKSLLFFGAMSRAFAQTDPTSQHELTLHCDADPGFFEEQDIVSFEPSVSGFMEFVQAKEHERWLAGSAIYFLGNKDRKRAGIMVSTSRLQPGAVQVQVIRPGKNAERLLFAMIEDPPSPIPFDMSFSDEGELTLNVAGVTGSVDLRAFDVEQIVFNCSTSEVNVTIVQQADE